MTSQPLDGWRGGYLRFHKSYVRSEPGPHMASSCDCRPNFVVYTRRIIGVIGARWSEACALMTIHVVVWALCVTLLPALAITRHPRKTPAPDWRRGAKSQSDIMFLTKLTTDAVSAALSGVLVAVVFTLIAFVATKRSKKVDAVLETLRNSTPFIITRKLVLENSLACGFF